VRLSAVEALLDRHLQPAGKAPLAVGFSGGGDSLALLLIVRRWAARHGREVIVLHVDHRLQPQSAAWADACEAVAHRLGLTFQRLAWLEARSGPGLPARARAARHALLATAARELGARVLLLGHTADDLAEAAAMRAEGSTTPNPRVFSPSPAWPEGRGVFLLRPLLATRRQALREHLAREGHDWLEDPANADPRYARARARHALATSAPTEAPADLRRPLGVEAVSLTSSGGLTAPRAGLSAVDLPRFIATAAVCAGGGARPPRRSAVEQLAARLTAEGQMIASLAGASVRSDAFAIRVLRDVGDIARRAAGPLRLAAGEIGVWDGRFEVEAHADILVRPLSGLARRLPPDERRSLAQLPAGDRAALPALVTAGGEVSCPLLGGTTGRVRPLALERWRAATGLIDREPK
jgi:tRNA(Ile)-lysidine synthase